MSITNIIIILSAVIVVLLLLIFIGKNHLKRLARESLEQWELVAEALRKRHDLIPNLVETFRGYENGQEGLVEDIIKMRGAAMKEEGCDVKKIECEYDLSKSLDKLMGLAGKNPEMSRDTNFLELRKEVADAEKDVDEKTKKYNEMVRYYNKHYELLVLKPAVAAFKLKRMGVFEFEV